jgi:hypothetical protein
MDKLSSYGQLEQYMKRFLEGQEQETFWYSGPLDAETTPYIPDLLKLQTKMITIDSQPGEINELCKTRAYISGFIKAKRFKKLLPNIIKNNQTALIFVSHIKKRNFKMQCQTKKFIPSDKNFVSKMFYHKEIKPVPDDIPLVVLGPNHPMYGKNAEMGGSDAHFYPPADWHTEYNMITNISLRNWMIKKTCYIMIIDMEFGKNTLLQDVINSLGPYPKKL